MCNIVKFVRRKNSIIFYKKKLYIDKMKARWKKKEIVSEDLLDFFYEVSFSCNSMLGDAVRSKRVEIFYLGTAQSFEMLIARNGK